MKTSQGITKEANIVPRIRLATRLEEGGVKGTGPHKVKLLREAKIHKRFNSRAKQEQYYIWLYMEEDGQEKRYEVSVYEKDDKGRQIQDKDHIHYLVQRLSSIPEGTKVILEYKRSGARGYIDVQETTKEGKEKEPEEEDIFEDIPEIKEEKETTLE